MNIRKFRKHRFFEMRILLHKRTDTIVPLNKICIWQFLSKAVLLQVIEYFSLQPGICRFVSMRIVELQTLLSTKAFKWLLKVSKSRSKFHSFLVHPFVPGQKKVYLSCCPFVLRQGSWGQEQQQKS